MATDRKPDDERIWESGWEGHTRAQRQRLARLSFAEKLRWLEEAQEMLTQLQRGAVGGAGRVAEPTPESTQED